MHLWVVLPAFNESDNLPAILAGLGAVAPTMSGRQLSVLLVDDGSTDGTAAAAQKSAGNLDLRVLTNSRNLGLAGTIRRGLNAALEAAGHDGIIISMDADNSHLPMQIPALLSRLEQGCDVAIASRFQPGAIVHGVPWHRRLLSAGLGRLFSAVYPISGVRDYSCGYRAYRADRLAQALERREEPLTDDGFAVMVRLLIALHKRGATFGEIPIVLRYDQKLGPSKMPVGRTVMRTLRVLWKERRSRS